MKHAAIVCAFLIAAACVALADDKIKKADSNPPPGGMVNEVKRVRHIGPDSTPTRAGQLEGGPRSVAFSPDGKLILVGAVDGGVGITGAVESSDAVTGWHRIGEHLGAVSGVAFMPAKTGSPLQVVSVGDDEMLHLALVDASLAVVSSASRPLGLGPLTALAVLDGTHVVVGSARGSIAVVKLAEQILVEKTAERHEGEVVALVALPKGRIASAGWDGAVKLSDASSLKELKAAKVASVELTALCGSSDGALLAAGSWKTGVQLLDASSLKTLATIEPHRGAASGLLLASKSRLVSASVADEMLAVSDLGTRSEIKSLKRTRVTTVPTGALAVSPDGTLVAAGINDGSVHLYQLEGTK